MAATCGCAWKPTAPALANTAGEGIVHGARGMLGGQDGAPHDYTLLPPGAPPRKLKSKEVGVVVPPGSVIHVLSGGGGGWGAAGATRSGGAGEGRRRGAGGVRGATN